MINDTGMAPLIVFSTLPHVMCDVIKSSIQRRQQGSTSEEAAGKYQFRLKFNSDISNCRQILFGMGVLEVLLEIFEPVKYRTAYTARPLVTTVVEFNFVNLPVRLLCKGSSQTKLRTIRAKERFE